MRSYCASDWDAVCAIYNLAKPDELRGSVTAAFIPPLQQDPHMRELFDASNILVAESQGRVVAFAGNRQAHITWLFVHPQQRRQGFARALLQEVLAGMGVSVSLNVAKTNLAARALYAGLGFVVAREFDGDFNGQICQAMRLTLTRSQ